MSSTAPDIIADLGALHRASIWENIILKDGLTSNGMDVLNSLDASPLERSPDRSSIHFPEDASTTANLGQLEPSNESNESPPTSKKNEPKEDSPRGHNAQALKHLTHGLPSSLGPFFQGMHQSMLTETLSC
jgi:E3 ubiquitin-protein ligase HUWE1